MQSASPCCSQRFMDVSCMRCCTAEEHAGMFSLQLSSHTSDLATSLSCMFSLEAAEASHLTHVGANRLHSEKTDFPPRGFHSLPVKSSGLRCAEDKVFYFKNGSSCVGTGSERCTAEGDVRLSTAGMGVFVNNRAGGGGSWSSPGGAAAGGGPRRSQVYF